MDGTPFGRYRLLALLGRGGMGEVWRAHDTETDRVVAIKLLPSALSADEEFQQRFRREAHAAARLNDPHVIPIHHYGEIEGQLYVDMRLIEGRDLETVLADGPLDPARAVRIVEQVARALNAAHKVGLIHRDIKPSNILLDADDFAYLIDFGIARAVDETRMTKSGNTIGTFQYIAPERLDDRAEEDGRADIYSLACVLYESLTGHPPFPGHTMAQLVNAHLYISPPRPSTSQPNIPAQIDEVIATGMAKDPQQRYATTIELANAARDAITEPIARPTPSSPPLPPGLRPIQVRQAAATKLRQPQPVLNTRAAPVTGHQADAFASPVVDYPSSGQTVPPVPTPKPRRPTGIIVAVIATIVVLGVGAFLLTNRRPSQTPVAQTTTTAEPDLERAPIASASAWPAERAAAQRRSDQHGDGHHRHDIRRHHDRDARQQLCRVGPGVPTFIGGGASQGICRQWLHCRAGSGRGKTSTKHSGSSCRVISLRATVRCILHGFHAELGRLLRSPIHPFGERQFAATDGRPGCQYRRHTQRHCHASQ